jgi:hypothetical protein
LKEGEVLFKYSTAWNHVMSMHASLQLKSLAPPSCHSLKPIRLKHARCRGIHTVTWVNAFDPPLRSTLYWRIILFQYFKLYLRILQIHYIL